MKDLVHLGTIGAPFGVRGAFRIKTRTENPTDTLTSYGALYDEQGIIFDITLVRVENPHTLIVQSQRAPDRTMAEGLRGTKLYVDKSIFEKLSSHTDADEIFYTELVGLVVKDESGEHIGVIEHIENYGASDILVIRQTDGTFVQVAFIEDSVPVVDIKKGFVTVVKDHLL